MNEYFSKEKLEVLRQETPLITPLINLKLWLLKTKKGYTQDQLDLEEFITRFKKYANGLEKTWKSLDWGNKENENLYDFAHGFIVQEIAEMNTKKNGKPR